MDTVSIYLFLNRNAVERKKLNKHRPKLKENSLNPDDVDYWKRFVRLAYRNSPQLLEFIRQIAPELKETERKNNRQINFDEWFEVFTEVRHAVTHSNMILKPSIIRTWSKIKRNILNYFFPGTESDSTYELHLTQKITNEDLERLAEYAYAIFKALSQTRNYDWHILQGQGNN